MTPRYHFIIGAIVSLLLWLHPEINYITASIIFLSSILIDFDHYIYY